jgi:hypothetical protein
MADKVTIDKIYVDQVETKFGPGTKTSIYVLEHPGVKMSSFKKVDWKAGDVVMIEITKKGAFTNFTPAAGESQLEARVKRLEDKVFGESAAKAPAKTTAVEEGADENW